MEVARSLPLTVSLMGFDINLNQCPPKPWLPPNINTHYWNFFEEPPVEFQGVFDMVHVRLITVTIKENDPNIVIRNLEKLLSETCSDLVPFMRLISTFRAWRLATMG